MAIKLRETTRKRIAEPDEVREAERTRVEILRLGDVTLARVILEPGWHWAEHVKPIVGTESCEIEHLNYVLSGRLRGKLNTGEEFLLEPGDFIYVAPGHDAWVVGDEPVVMLDIIGGEQYGKAAKEERKAA